MENILINIDSRFRNKSLYPNSGKFILELSEQFKNVSYIRISSIEIPNLYLTFSKTKYNTSFIINVNNTEHLIEIQEGFYNSTQLLNAIQEQLANYGLDINLNLTNGKVTISAKSTFNINFFNNSYYDSLGFHLGFRENIYTKKKSIESEAQLNILGDNYIFLQVNDYGKIYNFHKSSVCGSSVHGSCFAHVNSCDSKDSLDKKQLNILQSPSPSTFLAKIIMNANKTEHVFDNANFVTKIYNFNQPVNIEKFDIQLLDPYCNIIDMLKMDFSFTVEIGVMKLV